MKKKSKVTVFTDIIMLIMLFFTFLCSIIADKYTIMSKYIFINIFSDYKGYPIVEIDISRWRCKSDFNPLFGYEYPGHYSACYNNITGIPDLETPKEDCRKSPNVFYIEGIDETPMYAWRSKVICIRRENYSNKSMEIPSYMECPEGYRFCGNLNLYWDKFCVKPRYKCPIYYLQIKLQNEFNKSDDTIQYKELDKNHVLLYSNNSTEKLYEPGNYIKSEFQVGVNYPCIKKSRISTDGNVFPLILSESAQRIGCKPRDDGDDNDDHEQMHHQSTQPPKLKLLAEQARAEKPQTAKDNLNAKNKAKKNGEDDDDYFYDKRYTKIDSYTVTGFNNDNDLKYLNEIPNLGNWKQDYTKEINLYSRPYSYPNFTCANITHFSNIEESYKIIKVEHYIIIVILLSNLICLCMFISILSLMKITSRNQNLCLSIFKIIQSLVFMYFIARYILSIREKDDAFKVMFSFLFNNENCIDSVSKNALEKIYHFKEALSFREEMIEIIYYTGFPYFACIVIQFLKFVHKVYLRIRNKDRNKQAKGLLDILGDSSIIAQ